jgi:hypothetical protein
LRPQAVYQSLLHLTWIDKLLDNAKIIFTDLYRDQLGKPHTSIVECDFDAYFDQQMRELEPQADAVDLSASTTTGAGELTPPSSSDAGHEEEAPPPPVPGLLKGMICAAPPFYSRPLLTMYPSTSKTCTEHRNINRCDSCNNTRYLQT